tara:strand:- start:973 stop:1323 length:351 start_codon:yes stop_codon:yes gene_type:complete
MARHLVCRASDLPPGTRRIVTLAGRSIGVFNVKGEFYALRNACVHNQGPVCVGRVSGTYLPSAPDEYRPGLEGRVLRCPWHGWEYDITTAESLIDPTQKLRSYPVTVDDGNVVVDL